MVRVLILFAVIALLWWALRPRPPRPGRPVAEPPPAAPPAQVVECARCGVHLPRDEALPGPDGSLYCCEAHRRPAQAD